MDTVLDSLKTVSKTVIHKAIEFLENKTVTKSNDGKIVKQEHVEETIFPQEKRDEILNKLRKML